MRSPRDMQIIQIDITNACVHKCSNCTRFCGWHEKNFYMDFKTFKKSVQSLQDFNGIIGIMGGEPTLHPEFIDFINYFNKKIKKEGKMYPFIIPQENISEHRDLYLDDLNSKKGLWTSLCKKYYDYFEDINDIFDYACLNDHKNNGQHQALLVARKDLHISDDEFIKLRDNCWIQNRWSASITPKGCFFCEVAAALDMLFDGPGGWKIQKGWYLRRPQEFTDQLHWCELCGACLKVPKKKAKDEIDIISPTLYEKLKNNNTYKAKHHSYEVLDYEAYKIFDYDSVKQTYVPYLLDGQKRQADYNNELYPKKINVCYLSDNINKINNYKEITFNQLQNKEFDDWCLVLKDNIDINKINFNKIYNPGVLYINKNYYFVNKNAKSLQNKMIDSYIFNNFTNNKKCYMGEYNISNQDIKYSFIIMNSNLQNKLDRTLKSIFNQNYKNFNVYLSKENFINSLNIINQYKDINIISCNKNYRNELIKQADGDYIIFVNAGDEINYNFCAFSNYLLNEQKFDIIEYPYEHIKNQHINFIDLKHEYYNKKYNNECYKYFMNEKEERYLLCNKIIKNDLMKQCIIENLNNNYFDESIYTFPLYYNCESYYSVNSEFMYKYYAKIEQKLISLNEFKKYILDLRNVYEYNYKFILQHNPSMKNIDNLRNKFNFSFINKLFYLLNDNDKQQAKQYIEFLFDKRYL